MIVLYLKTDVDYKSPVYTVYFTLSKYTKTKTQFPNDNAASKSIYLAIKNIENAWKKPIDNWGLILNQFLIIFEVRCRL